LTPYSFDMQGTNNY